MTIDEIIDFVHNTLTVNCLLPTILPTIEIRRLIEQVALGWFYENYSYSVIKGYYYVPLSTLLKEEFTQYQYITLPCDIQNVTWVYQLTDKSLFSLGFGVGSGQGSVSLGASGGVITNQPFLNSYLTTIGELGVYKVIIDSFGDMLNQLTKFTLKHDYNFPSKRLHILSPPCRDIILECYIQILPEELYETDKFKRFVVALAKQQLGRVLTFSNIPLPGNITLNGEMFKTEGDAELEKVKEEIKAQSTTSWFIMTKR